MLNMGAFYGTFGRKKSFHSWKVEWFMFLTYWEEDDLRFV